MRNLAFAAAALATLAVAISPASAQVRRPAADNAYAAAQAQAAQQQKANPLPNHGNVTRDPDAFIRDYDRNNPPGTQWD